MVSFEWYRSFIAVYRVGTVSGAAQVLNLTQPAVSQHLTALEKALGIRLFERTPRHMVPTSGGMRLYNQIADSIEQLESVVSKMSSASISQLVRLGAPQEFFVEKILSRLPKSDSNYYTVTFGLAQNLIKQLVSGNLDLVISTLQIQKAEIVYQPLFEENFWLVGPKDINLQDVNIPNALDTSSEGLKNLEKWLRSQSIISYSEQLPIIRRFWRTVFGRRIAVDPKIIIPDLRGIRQAVELGLGISILPDYLCENSIKENRLTLILNPVKAVKNVIWLAFRKSDIHMPRTQSFLDLFS
ncbi:MAG: HTH-type transcriptional activator CmpR [Chroococcidiopsis sp. SAG 2025]|uniref:LysR family transcriptional regulator n=1 Tax=Chroococcidiopsis sp. SAG 2025 TaxID=171389 RepID=UPI0029371C2E|nr:LysR family transcriptional regulator [Chroococcidiopsis sp. SAG 2025]MDV2997314.1 HTH-type transcriptional activator CmpR [Chroococcidiopsis sp. SAG 2025]